MALTTSKISSSGYTAQVQLSNGMIAGEGSGPTPESAHFYAVADAIRSTDDRFVTAGRGHVVYLDEQGQRSIAAYLASKGLPAL